MIINFHINPHEINCFSFECSRIKIPRVLLGVLIFFYCIPVADKEERNMKDFFFIELERDNNESEFLSEDTTKVRYMLLLLFELYF